jgi:hypothetical protein
MDLETYFLVLKSNLRKNYCFLQYFRASLTFATSFSSIFLISKLIKVITIKTVEAIYSIFKYCLFGFYLN